ncbi:hypothetical protein IEO21_08909 [Rhodonia placenta]|uniref:Uncharacterized protein n=1 Tax=Rhodonia placenta TaxID=104341 RepID=A0A8H7TYS2_9APHY|nr:hypothetical protein IEO21_08909 [Postia placenta]
MASQFISDYATLFSVEGLVAVVTGGATGIGLMIATALENNGAIVYIVGRRQEALDKAVKERSKHGNMIALKGDITDRASLEALAGQVKARHGYIDLLVNNAGVMIGKQPKLPTPAEAGGDITRLQEARWSAGSFDTFGQTFHVNVSGVWFCTVAFLELLHAGNTRSKAHGVTSQVISVSSIASVRKDSGVFSLGYTLSKAAVTHLGKMMAHYLKDWQIRSNVIAPGLFPSEMTGDLLSEQMVKSTIPLQRAGNTDDMGGLVIYLASKAGAYVDGCVHLIDGGRMLSIPSVY